MKHKRITLSKTHLSNDWLFGRVMSDTELCRLLLEKVLNLNIRKVELINSQKSIDNSQHAKGVRLDLYIADDRNTIYNLEMQVKNRAIARRSRYYQSSIDIELMHKGELYKTLNTSYIIFICMFDMFGQGRHLYSFQNQCDQDKDLLLNDGTHKVFLNTRGTQNDVDEEINEILAYIENSTEQTAKKSKSELVQKIHSKVEIIRENEESEVEFMTYMQKLYEEREEGREEGILANKIETVETLLQLEIDINVIRKTTGFSQEEIEEISNKMI